MGDEGNSETTVTEVAEKKKNQPLKIDFKDLFGSDHDEPVEDIVVVPTNRRRKKREKERKQVTESSENNDDASCAAEDLSCKSDHELKELLKGVLKL
ncbi:Gag-Pro-Pol polyprotein [Bienertia sinuspersici]